MSIHRLSSTDAFVVVDLDGADTASGIVRCARKILTDGAVALARSITYGYAALGVKASGASGGINAEGDARDGAIAAFVEEVPALTSPTTLSLTAGRGVTVEESAPLSGASPDDSETDRLIAVSAVAAAAAFAGSLDGITVVIESLGPRGDAVGSAFTAAGAVVTVATEVPPGTDLWCVGSKVGVVDHDVAQQLACRAIVPIGPLPVTARGLAVARRHGVEVLPDFLTTSGPLIATAAPENNSSTDAGIAERVTAALTPVLGHEHGALLGACFAAEEFLSTWRDELPFGRPLA